MFSLKLKTLVLFLFVFGFSIHADALGFGLGVRESAMANAGVAMWASTGALAHNPAASANLASDRVVAGQTSFVQFKSTRTDGSQIQNGDVQSMAPYIASFYKYEQWTFGVGITSLRLNLSGSTPADLASNQPSITFDNLVSESTGIHFSFSKKWGNETFHEWSSGGQISLEREANSFSAAFPVIMNQGNIFFRSKSQVDSVRVKFGSIVRLDPTSTFALVVSSTVATLGGSRVQNSSGGVTNSGVYTAINTNTTERILITESWNARFGYSKKITSVQFFSDLNFSSNQRNKTASVSTLQSPFIVNPVFGLVWDYSERWHVMSGVSTDFTIDQTSPSSQSLPRFSSYRANHLLTLGLERNNRSDILGISFSYSSDQQENNLSQRLYALNFFTSYNFND